MKTHSEIIEKYSNWKVAPEAIINEALIFSPSMILPAMQEVENQTREEMFEFAEYCTVNGCKSLNGLCILDNAENHYFTDMPTLYEHWKSLNK